MSINTYAVVVSIEECPVRDDVFCVAVVRIKFPTHLRDKHVLVGVSYCLKVPRGSILVFFATRRE